MTDETKILFEQLADAINANQVEFNRIVEAINSPDWWGIIHTIINTIVIIAIAIVQIRIQRQQTHLQKEQIKQQEYKLYRRMYKLFSSIHRVADALIFKIYVIIAFRNNIYTCDELKKESQKLYDELDDVFIDVDLKIPEETNRFEQYKLLMTLIIGTINRIEQLDENRQIKTCPSEDKNLILENIKKDKVYLMEQISSCIIDCDGKTEVEKSLMCFLSIKEKVCDNKFLYTIKAKI